MAGAGGGQAGAGGLQGQQEDREGPLLEVVDESVAAGDRGAAVQHAVVDVLLLQPDGEQTGHLRVLGEYERGLLLGELDTSSSSNRFSLPERLVSQRY